jgi:hypothetical protein
LTEEEIAAQLREAVVKAARDLAKGKLKFTAKPLAKAPKASKRWKQRGNGIYSTEPAAAVQEIFDSAAAGGDDVFEFDCASAAWVVVYKAILDVIGPDKFDKLFNKTLIILGAHASGTPLGDEYYRDSTKNPTVIEEFTRGPYFKGDQRYFSVGGKKTGGQNLFTMEDGDITDDSEVYGHGAGTRRCPSGILKPIEFERAYGSRNAWGCRISAKVVRNALYGK